MITQKVKKTEYNFEDYLDYVRLARKNQYGFHKIIIFDLDGVIADIRHRLHFVDLELSALVGKSVNWDKFFEACPQDKPNHDMVELLKIFMEREYRIYILTGRSEDVRGQTEDWFDYYGVVYDFMFMRPSKNYEADYSLKEKWVKKIIESEGKDIIYLAFDDREQNIGVFREAGIQAFHVVINYED